MGERKLAEEAVVAGGVPRKNPFGGIPLTLDGCEIDCLPSLFEMAGEVTGYAEAEPVACFVEIEFDHGVSTSVPTKGTNAAGTRTLPSDCWWFSRIATNQRVVAKVPLSVAAICGLPAASR